jgi:hypothetical protein
MVIEQLLLIRLHEMLVWIIIHPVHKKCCCILEKRKVRKSENKKNKKENTLL